MQTSETVAALFTALSAAQGEMDGAKKTSANEGFKRNGKVSTYADLASGWDACREALSKNGLSVIQLPGECADQRIAITTMLCHKSGEWIKETLYFPIGQVNAHGLGSAITYGRRYALFAIVGLAPEDDDGNAATAAAPAQNDAPRQSRLKGPIKLRADLRKAAGAVADAIAEAVDGGDPDSLDRILEEHKAVINQVVDEGPEEWWKNPDWGLEAKIENARKQLNGDI